MAPPLPLSQWPVDSLQVAVFANRAEMGAAAAAEAIAALHRAMARSGRARIILASAPSQNELLAGLVASDLDWRRVTIFHMDEYLVGPEHPTSFRRFLQEHLLSHVGPAVFHGLGGEAHDMAAECARYTALLAEAPVDLACVGIGENGHLAFNDPATADFHDLALVKQVEIDDTSRQQQVNDGAFATRDAVPRIALTLTIPALFSAAEVVCAVPGPRKARAVRDTLMGPIAPACPASILRRHPRATLYLDAESAALVR